MGAFPASLCGGALPATPLLAPPPAPPPPSRGLVGGLPPSGGGLAVLFDGPVGGAGLGGFFVGGLSRRGGGAMFGLDGILGGKKGTFDYCDLKVKSAFFSVFLVFFSLPEESSPLWSVGGAEYIFESLVPLFSRELLGIRNEQLKSVSSRLAH